MTHEYDLVILGAGPGGTRAAQDGVRLGLKTALVEKADLGGTCLNWGCIPTKLFLGSTAVAPLLHSQKKLKGANGELAFNMPSILQRKDRFLKGSRQAVGKQLTGLNVTIFTGEGRLKDRNTLLVSGAENHEVTFKKLVIATGSSPAAFPNLEPDGDCVLNSDHATTLDEAPESMIIVGAGAIGLEMGDYFSRLGTKITLVEGMDRLVPTEDADIGEAMRKILKREGWAIHTGKKVASLKTINGNAVLTFEDGETLTAAKSLMAAGRTPNGNGLNIEVTGAEILGAGWIKTNASLLAADNIYAIGDVNGRTLLAHAADHQARYVVRHAAGKTTAAYESGPIPACVYGHTEILRVGPTMQELEDAGHEVAVTSAQLVANPIAQSYGTTQGFIKALWVDSKVRSIAAIGHGVSHLVTAATIIVKQQWTQDDVHSIIWAHPTLDEALEMALIAPYQ